MNAELKQAITARKLTEQATTLAKTAVEMAAKQDLRVVAPRLHAVMASTPEFATLIQSAAKIYAENNPHVDLRMEAGKKMLLAIAEADLNGNADGMMNLELPEIHHYLQSQFEQSAPITDAFNELMAFYKENEEHAEKCAEAMFKAIRFEHPTLAQCFLASLRHAALATPDQAQYTIIGNAYIEAIPYI
jgi:hypothetical protein